MRILALDHGTKRIGVALSDETKTIAQPLEYILTEPFAAFLDRLKKLLVEKEVDLIIIGLPRNMDGSYGPAAQKVEAFVAVLRSAVTVPVKTLDERLTSAQANRILIQGGVRRDKRKEKVDKMAAAILLQSYLDAGRRSRLPVDKLKFKLTIAYDGTAYQGWQVQKIGTGVQEKIEAACQQIFPGVKRLHSSSRTDTGVHALGMVAHVEIPRAEFKMPDARLALALNACLPDDIRVLDAVRAPADFHARFDAIGKQYRYYVWNHHAMNPLLLPARLALSGEAGPGQNARGGEAVSGAARFQILRRHPRVRNEIQRPHPDPLRPQKIRPLIHLHHRGRRLSLQDVPRPCRHPGAGGPGQDSAGGRGRDFDEPRPPRGRHDRPGPRPGAAGGFLSAAQIPGPRPSPGAATPAWVSWLKLIKVTRQRDLPVPEDGHSPDAPSWGCSGARRFPGARLREPQHRDLPANEGKKPAPSPFH